VPTHCRFFRNYENSLHNYIVERAKEIGIIKTLPKPDARRDEFMALWMADRDFSEALAYGI